MNWRTAGIGITGFLLGSLLGIGAGLLNAPVPGSQIRFSLIQHGGQARSQAQRFFNNQQHKSRAAFQGALKEANHLARRVEWACFEASEVNSSQPATSLHFKAATLYRRTGM